MYDFKVVIRIFLIIINFITPLHCIWPEVIPCFFFLQGRIVIFQGDSVSTKISVAQSLIFYYWNKFYFVCSYYLYLFFIERNNG